MSKKKTKRRTRKGDYRPLPPQLPHGITANVSVRVSMEDLARLPYHSQRQAFMVGIAELVSATTKR